MFINAQAHNAKRINTQARVAILQLCNKTRIQVAIEQAKMSPKKAFLDHPGDQTNYNNNNEQPPPYNMSSDEITNDAVIAVAEPAQPAVTSTVNASTMDVNLGILTVHLDGNGLTQLAAHLPISWQLWALCICIVLVVFLYYLAPYILSAIKSKCMLLVPWGGSFSR